MCSGVLSDNTRIYVIAAARKHTASEVRLWVRTFEEHSAVASDAVLMCSDVSVFRL